MIIIIILIVIIITINPRDSEKAHSVNFQHQKFLILQRSTKNLFEMHKRRLRFSLHILLFFKFCNLKNI